MLGRPRAVSEFTPHPSPWDSAVAASVWVEGASSRVVPSQRPGEPRQRRGLVSDAGHSASTRPACACAYGDCARGAPVLPFPVHPCADLGGPTLSGCGSGTPSPGSRGTEQPRVTGGPRAACSDRPGHSRPCSPSPGPWAQGAAETDLIPRIPPGPGFEQEVLSSVVVTPGIAGLRGA